jgi:hypothetical protein
MEANAQRDEMHDRLMDFYMQNSKERFCEVLQRLLEDPLKPRDEQGRFRVNPIVLILTLVLALVFGTFLLFNLVGS